MILSTTSVWSGSFKTAWNAAHTTSFPVKYSCQSKQAYKMSKPTTGETTPNWSMCGKSFICA